MSFRFDVKVINPTQKPIVILAKGNCSTFIVLKYTEFNNKKLVYLGGKKIHS
jgi:hypothetical protein